MSVVAELIQTEDNGSLSFGNYELGAKAKLDNYEVGGDLYKVKTYGDITKLEKNGLFVYESVPGTAVHQFMADESGVSFLVEAAKDCQITLELEENQEYTVTVDGAVLGQFKTNRGGKLSLSLEVEAGKGQTVTIRK
ncbi:MAG: M1 family metallopeptidase [Lachnospiraceae bacterium]|jgi:hypothetical protein|nr:M1 family metallopeptidase [Lachnospiraceae bacterium]